MNASAIIHPHPDYPNGGYAIVEIVGAQQPGDTISLTILDLFQERYLNTRGWEATPQAFGPYPVQSTATDRFRFAIGPEIVNQLEEFKSLRLDFADQQTFVTWPGTVLRDPSAKPSGTIFAEAKPDATLSETLTNPPPELPQEIETSPPPPQPDPVPETTAPVAPPLMSEPTGDSIDAILSGGGADTSDLLPGEEEEVTRQPILEVPPSRAGAVVAPAVEPVQRDTTPATPSQPQPPERRKPSVAGPLLVLLLMIAGAAGGGWWWMQNQADPVDGQETAEGNGSQTPPDSAADDGETTDRAGDTDTADGGDTTPDPDSTTDDTEPSEPDETTDVADGPETPDARDCSIEAALALEGDMLLILSDFTDAADAGDCDTQITPEFALRAVEEAAGRGDASAMLALGALYDESVAQPLLETRLGLSLTDDPSLALGWYGRAAEAGSPDAEIAVEAVCEATEGTDNMALDFVREDYCQ